MEDHPAVPYALGHSDLEVERLETQARIVDPLTRRFWRSAGIREGMRVLDVGCGAGHTALLLADLVGPAGQVVGIDTARAALVAARARSAGRETVRYVLGDPAVWMPDVRFDAVVGRYVLMFQPDPARFLAAVAGHARPGGIVAFHELDAEGITSRPPVPTFDRVARWNAEATRRYGANPNFGAAMYGVYVAAGLPAPTVLAEAVHGRGDGARDVLTQVRNLARSLLPEMERHGVATATDLDVETLHDRMLEEARRTDSVVVGHLQVGAHCVV